MKRDYAKPMTKGNFFRYYNKLNGADAYIIMFIYKKMVYMATAKHIKQAWTVEGRESSSNGGFQKWKMSMNNKHKEQLIRSGAVVVASEEEFNAMPYPNNKGHRCEWWLHKEFNLGTYKPDRQRFDKGGDVEINGIQYQVKFENASLTNVRTLRRAQDSARQ